MKKRIFSRLMAMFMAVALLSTTALAYVEINQDFIDKADVTTEERGTYIDLKNDDYKLTETIETSHTLRFRGDSENPDAEATLDLDGWTIDHGGAKGAVIEVIDGKLTLEDSSGKDETGEYVSAGKGKITGGKEGGVRLESSEFIMKAGNIVGNVFDPVDRDGAGGIYGTKKSTIEINGGSIKNNKGANFGPASGSAICIGGNTSLTINGGTIAENTGSDYAFCIADKDSTGTIINGTIVDNGNEFFTGKNWEIKGGVVCGNGDGDHPEHTFSDATCTEDSVCTYCGKAGTEKATGHTYALATCTEPETCHCGETRGEANGHTSGAPVRENEVDASAGMSGSYDEVVYCTVCHEELSRETRTIPALPMPIDFGDGFTGGTDTGTTIDDETTPLAGIVTEAQFLDELYKHEGSPDVELVEKYASHEYAPAISWALANAIVGDSEDFDPDEVVTVALLREVLTAYVEYKGIDFTVTVTGADDDLVLDLSERLNVFFAQLEK